MKQKMDRIEFRISVDDKEKIIANAEANGLRVGPYLRSLGLAGFKLFSTREFLREGKIALAAGAELVSKSHRAKVG
ncbi:MAG: hypothetical protein ACHQ1H_06910 [Nitrososphaerales archaeon]